MKPSVAGVVDEFWIEICSLATMNNMSHIMNSKQLKHIYSNVFNRNRRGGGQGGQENQDWSSWKHFRCQDSPIYGQWAQLLLESQIAQSSHLPDCRQVARVFINSTGFCPVQCISCIIIDIRQHILQGNKNPSLRDAPWAPREDCLKSENLAPQTQSM